MILLDKIKRRFYTAIPETAPEAAYDLWAKEYDQQPDNLMLALDEQLFSKLIDIAVITGRDIIDVGCGTGRHWQKLLDLRPDSLTGYDVSGEMLAMLKQKFPGQTVHQQTGDRLNEPADHFDMLISTLTMAHIPHALTAIREWHRVLKPGGTMIITDYHPAALQRGGQRTFHFNGQTVAVKNYIHPINEILRIGKSEGLELQELQEMRIDDSMRGRYEKQNALHVFDKFKGSPIIYGCRFTKRNGVQ